MIGIILNAVGILVGGVLGAAGKARFSLRFQALLKSFLGIGLTAAGLKLIWHSLNGPLSLMLKIFGLVMLALILGRLLGRLLRLQKFSNQLGTYARELMGRAEKSPSRFSDGFTTCAILFCAAPLSVLGSFQAGLSGQWLLLAIKGIMDGLAVVSFYAMFGRGVILSVIPVVAWQGTIALGSAALARTVLQNQPALIDSLNMTSGILAMSIALVVLEIKKVELADYLPSLLVAPLLVYLFGVH